MVLRQIGWQPRSWRLSRRAALGAAGAGLAAAYLSACGGGGGSAGGTGGATSSSPPAPVTSGSTQVAGAAGGAPVRGGVLKVHVLQEPFTLAPYDTALTSNSHMIRLTHGNGLLKADYNLKVVPDLAESYKVSDDGTQYTFVLREGLKFSNGKPLDAKVVVDNFEKMRDPATGSFLRAYYAGIKTIEATDARTVRFTLPEPFSPFLAFVTDRSFITDVAAYSSTNPVGAGPWILTDWVRGSHMKLKRNPDYWDKGKPYADELFIQFQQDETQGFNLLRTKEVHIGNVPDNVWKQNQSNKDLVLMEKPSISITNRIFFDHSQPPFNDQRMRDAINLAIDREQVIQIGYFGAGLASPTAYTKDNPWFVDVNAPKQDLQKAREMVKAAGFEGWQYEMPQPNDGPSQRIGEYFQQEWGKIGLNVKLRPVETGEFVSNLLVTKKFLITHVGATGRLDPDQDLYAKCHSKGSQNWTNYANSKMDDLLDKGRRATAFDERKKIYDEIQKLHFQDKPWIYTGLRVIRRATQTNVKGLQLHPETQNEYFEEVFLQK